MPGEKRLEPAQEELPLWGSWGAQKCEPEGPSQPDYGSGISPWPIPPGPSG